MSYILGLITYNKNKDEMLLIIHIANKEFLILACKNVSQDFQFPGGKL